jgi:hypothetical protein
VPSRSLSVTNSLEAGEPHSGKDNRESAVEMKEMQMERPYHNTHTMAVHTLTVCLLVLGTTLMAFRPVIAQFDDPTPPAEVVKLVFIHHSCGENWLSDDDGGLGRALSENSFFVSDTNYGWGPDSIGDRTDVTDWPEWFTGPNSSRYLTALYSESGQSSWYTRTLPDPGGENQIILFKSCFPNSNLEGNPGDPPRRGEGLTVSNAKAIYNELLTYFATRPDKLFVAITAPPVQDRAYAHNARAFNTWLVTKWLDGYEGSNIAIFDFYTVLTDPDNHHRFREGGIEYVNDRGGDTLYYPTNGDDHPSPIGNRKATEEFVPLLNVYYHRWRSGTSAAPTPAPEPTPVSLVAPTETISQPKQPSPLAETGEVIDDFEGAANEWFVYTDEEADTGLSCNREETVSYNGTAALYLEYDIVPGGWASCNLEYLSPEDWHDKLGLSVYLNAERIGQPVIVLVKQMTSTGDWMHFEYRMQTGPEAVDGWQRVAIPWEEFVQPPWEGDGIARFDPSQAMGLAFLFEGPDDRRESGKLWVDDVILLSDAPPVQAATKPVVLPEPTVSSTEQPSASQTAEESEAEDSHIDICPGSAATGLVFLVGTIWARRRMPWAQARQ